MIYDPEHTAVQADQVQYIFKVGSIFYSRTICY